jgi:hypothetical protein
MVAPKRVTPAIAWIYGAAAYIAGVTLLSWHWVLAGVAFAIITVGVTIEETRSICPLCGSANLMTEEPRVPPPAGPVGFQPPAR